MEKVICKALGLVLTLALLCGSAALPASQAEAPGGDIDAIIAGMSLRDKLAQMMMPAFRGWKDDDDANAERRNMVELNDEVRQCLSENRFGGVIIFGENSVDAEQVLRLTSDMQAATLAGGGLPLLIAADQEGGSITRLSFGTDGVGNMALAASGDPENARAMASVYGEELTLVGVNADFAPVVDVNDNPSNPIIGVRSFSDDARVVSEYGVAFTRGLHEQGVISAVKHFPGHGNTNTDSHTGLPLVDRDRDELMANELIPFKAAIEAGVDMVMTAHIQYPRLEAQTYTSTATGEEVYLPATMSKTILTDLLRGELGFEGVIVSDALGMDAISKNYATDDVLCMTINAGVNLLLPVFVYGTRTLAALPEFLDRAVCLVEEGKIEMARVDDSVRRILALKQKYGLLDRVDFTVTDEAVAAAVTGCGSEAHRQVAWDIAEKSLTLLKNENDAFPIRVQPGESVLLLISGASRGAVGDFVTPLLTDAGLLPEGATMTSMVIEPDTAQACVDAAKQADHVLVASRAWNVACLDPSTEGGFPVGIVNQIIDDCHADGKTVPVICCQLPYEAACYPEADALLEAYCSSVMRAVPPASGAGSAYVPNLPAAICAAFGASTPQGKLPVNVPTLDEACRPTDEILYARQVGEGE